MELLMAQLVKNCIALDMTETKDVKAETQKMYRNYFNAHGNESPSFEDFVFQTAKVPDLKFIYQPRDTVRFVPIREESADWQFGYITSYGKDNSPMLTVMTDKGEREVHVENLRRAKFPPELLSLAVSLVRLG
jgi:hypothetical protein